MTTLLAVAARLLRALGNTVPEWHLGRLRALQQQRQISRSDGAHPAHPLAIPV